MQSRPSGSVRLLLTVLTLCLLQALYAQQPRERASARVRVRDVEIDHVLTPGFQAALDPRAKRENDWCRLTLTYESVARGEWIDELVLEWSVAILPKTGGDKPVVMRKTVTYLDVEDGDHYAVVLMRPTFIQRRYGTKRISKSDIWIHLEVKVDGHVMDTHDYARQKAPRSWWTAKAPRVLEVEHALLARNETPFAPLDSDFYEYIKPER